jgi:hypothetical protein
MELDYWVLATLGLVTLWQVNRRQQNRRIMLLGRQLVNHNIEKLMEALTQGYLRALGEREDARREQVWSYLATQEEQLSSQMAALAADMAGEDTEATRASTLAMGLPWASQWLPRATFDLREALAVHARGIAEVVGNAAGRSPRDKAFMLSAELFLLQHTCHWYCRSRSVASARLLARHQTAYAQALAAVSETTRGGLQAIRAA